jgi:hypothetical protein
VTAAKHWQHVQAAVALAEEVSTSGRWLHADTRRAEALNRLIVEYLDAKKALEQQ